MAADAAGNVYLTGDTWNELSRGYDTWLAKYGPAGRMLWKRPFGLKNDAANGVAADAMGNVFLAGVNNLQGGDAWVAKFDTRGALLWKRQIGTAASDAASGLATDADGNVYLTGGSGGALAAANRGYSDAWVAKFDAAGEEVWKRQIGTAAWDESSSVATDAAANVYLAGNTDGALGGVQHGEGDAWVAKCDAAGHVLWKRQLGTDRFDTATAVAPDAAGNVYLTGWTYGSLGDDSFGYVDAWVAMYDSRGSLRWKRQLGTAEYDIASGAATDAEGNVYLTGITWGSLGGANRGEYDAWLAKYDAAGEEQWIRQPGTVRSDGANGVATDTDGNVYLTGYTEGSLGGASRGGPDAWVAKFSTLP